ncbi:MAG: aldehyde dehydrogenase family protein [Actinobacteria bacterium]|nr:aldehyde dehydrogenase family protein [Actinomycetota bacterium]
MKAYDKVYINGKWVAASSQDSIQVFDSTDESVMATIPAGTAKDVDAAAKAAHAAFEAWAALDKQERAKYMSRVGDGLAARMDEIATAISRETGMSKMLSQLVQVGLPINSFKQASAIAESYVYEKEVGSSLVVREPIGVVGCITPWNYPLHQIAAKVAFAMAAGCTVVLKPSEVAPLDAFMLAEIIDEVGLPMQVGAESVKRVALELGGKSANIIGDDLDAETFGKAVKSGVGKAFLNSGQTCSALTRMLVPKSRLAEAEEHAAAAASAMKPVDPFTEGMNLGPLASAAQRDRVNGYIQKGIDEGAKLLVGGVGVPEGVTKGYYVKPTVFSGVTENMTIAREEIFGPVLSIMAYNDIDDAVRIANATDYGLAGGVWMADKEKATAVARRMRTGQVEINGGAFNPNAPFGGYKQSGNGREYGEYGFEEFLEIKSLQR